MRRTSSGATGLGGNATAGTSTSGSTGMAGCGVCATRPCWNSFYATVTTGEGGGTIQNLKAESSELVLQCQPDTSKDACVWTCGSFDDPLPVGDNTVVFSAPGYETKTVTFTVAPPPSDCGCCDCCPSHRETVSLTANGDDAGACCRALDSDGTNCGTCGNTCTSAEACVNGECGDCVGAGASCGEGAPCCTGQICCDLGYPTVDHGTCVPALLCVD